MRENFESINSSDKIDRITPVIMAVPVEDFKKLEGIRSVGKTEHLEMGDCIELSQDKRISYSTNGAYHAVAGIIQTGNNKTYVFESFLDTITAEQEEIIKNATSGIVGGGKTAVKNLAEKFEGKNINILQSPGKYQDFNMVVIQDRLNVDSAPLLCYRYDSIQEFCNATGAAALRLCKNEAI